MKHRKYSNEFKLEVVQAYLSGVKLMELCRRHEINKDRVQDWTNKYLETGGFPDGRGKSKGGGRPRKVDTTCMTKDEYIAYLEMENTILKQLRSLSNNPQK